MVNRMWTPQHRPAAAILCSCTLLLCAATAGICGAIGAPSPSSASCSRAPWGPRPPARQRMPLAPCLRLRGGASMTGTPVICVFATHSRTHTRTHITFIVIPPACAVRMIEAVSYPAAPHTRRQHYSDRWLPWQMPNTVRAMAAPCQFIRHFWAASSTGCPQPPTTLHASVVQAHFLHVLAGAGDRHPMASVHCTWRKY